MNSFHDISYAKPDSDREYKFFAEITNLVKLLDRRSQSH